MNETLRKVPTLSLSDFTSGSPNQKSQFVDDLIRGFKDYGFIILKNHPIKVDLLRKAYALSEEFFHLATETKQKYSGDSIGGQRGFTSFGKEHAKGSDVKDLKEFWHVGQEYPSDHPDCDELLNNMWPTEVNGFESTFKDMYRALEDTGRIILKALTGPLEVEEDYFDKMTEYGNSILRLLHYPPIPEGADPRCIRAAEHEDINLITLLVSASAAGLQLKDRDGKWLDVVAGADDVIVDSGDMLARITNEVIPATTHRVVNPDDKNTDRFSMPFFMHPKSDAMLTCLPSCKGEGAKYADITADDFLKERLKEIGLTK